MPVTGRPACCEVSNEITNRAHILKCKTYTHLRTCIYVYYTHTLCACYAHEQLSPELALTARDADAETRHGGQFKQLRQNRLLMLNYVQAFSEHSRLLCASIGISNVF
jgi:hypothetical protein